jgi:hypothetical protein
MDPMLFFGLFMLIMVLAMAALMLVFTAPYWLPEAVRLIEKWIDARKGNS